MSKINKEEYEILKGLDNKWKWVARDRKEHCVSFYLNQVMAYQTRPNKHYESNIWSDGSEVEYLSEELFQFIQWEDENPYNIQELIEEYESENNRENNFKKIKEVDIDTSKLAISNDYFYVKKNEEKEVKDIDPLMKYVNREIEMIKDTLPHMDRVESEGRKEWHEGFLSALENVRDKLNQLDEPEVLSEELPVIPNHVADWMEQYNEYGFDLYPALKKLEINELIWEDVYEWYRKNTREFVNAYLTGLYEVEEEQKFYVDLNTAAYVAKWDGDGSVRLYTDSIYGSDEYELHLTEREIKDYDERFWPFRKPVEEVE